MTKTIKEVSRTAQLVALTHFASGAESEVSFSQGRYHSLTAQHKEGLHELEHNGMVELTEAGGIKAYRSTSRIGVPTLDVDKVSGDENYNIYKG